MTEVPRGPRRPLSSRAAVPPIRRSLLRVAFVLGVAYLSLSLGLAYWQVVQADVLTSDPANPLVQAVQLDLAPGRIFDVNGNVLVDNVQAPDGSNLRRYHEESLGPVIGYRSAQFGQAGLERAYSAQLVGLTTNDPVDRLLRKFRANPYSPQDLVLGIDVRIQRKAADLLGNQRGAIVAIEPSTGRILALVSAPGFDANAVVDPQQGAAAFKRLSNDPATPLFDRATLGRYVPGSVLKIVTAIAGLGSGAITSQTVYPDQPAEERTGFLVDGYRVIDGHHPATGSQALDFPLAVEVSCNIYFAHVGLAVGGAALSDWASRLGFGGPIPFDVPTEPSQLTNGGGPDGGFKDRVELANAAYGQAETFVTPLQMALVAATVANHGVLMYPHLVVETRDPDGTRHPIQPQVWRQVLDPADASTIANAMELAVEGPLGRPFAGAAKVPGVPTAGKTGTAQLGGEGEPHSWFIGFAPVASPRIAVAVLVERAGSGATVAAPIAGELMQYALALQP